MNLLKDKQVAIIGGGPGGLTLARILQMNGAEVKVYEREVNKEARVQGATLDLHEESGLKALSEAGLMDAFRANYRPGADKVRLMNKHAEILIDEHITGKEESRPEIDRGPLRKILLDSLEPNTVVWDSQFTSLSKHKDGWKIEFKNSPAVYADIVIGADGANSKVRPYITDIKPFFAGLTAIEGAVYNSAEASPNMHKLVQGGKIFAMGDDQTLIISSKGDGSLAFYVGFKTNEDWLEKNRIDFSNKEQVNAWFKKEFKGWDASWQELFENADPHFIPRPQYCMPLDQAWNALPNLTMLGDAAHLMPPYAGEGVNMAMLDALELGKCLLNTGFADTQSAIAAYETQMRARASEVAKDSIASMEALHAPDALSWFAEIVG
jgi:2-polyprenyl-6-methoxyphenol hydroxylase-like FAD-dependent oxidoreductase